MENVNDSRFEYLLNTLLNDGDLSKIDEDLAMLSELSDEEKEYFKDVDLTEVLFI